MNTLHEWAFRWGIPPCAIEELANLQGASVVMPKDQASEAAVLAQTRLQATYPLFRNNVGMATDARGNHINYGLANDTPGVREKYGSSDLIGIEPILITAEHVGDTIGQFVALEIKRVGWKFKGTPREIRQQNFINLIEANGGHASFVTGVNQT